MGGVTETSVNAYMALNNQDYSERRKIRKKKKNKRAVSQINGLNELKGVDSAQNLLTMNDELDEANKVERPANVTDEIAHIYNNQSMIVDGQEGTALQSPGDI